MKYDEGKFLPTLLVIEPKIFEKIYIYAIIAMSQKGGWIN